mmetsp:Transcript_124382/g.348372  ORF Transcript_124382/g.348372 Transcript_124382/m.348372 type:complete len:206 (+) Transcript_124382:2665-3282(+)
MGSERWPASSNRGIPVAADDTKDKPSSSVAASHGRRGAIDLLCVSVRLAYSAKSKSLRVPADARVPTTWAALAAVAAPAPGARPFKLRSRGDSRFAGTCFASGSWVTPKPLFWAAGSCAMPIAARNVCLGVVPPDGASSKSTLGTPAKSSTRRLVPHRIDGTEARHCSATSSKSPTRSSNACTTVQYTRSSPCTLASNSSITSAI